MSNLPVIITPLRTYLYGQTNFWMEVICLQQLLIEYLERQFFENCWRKFHFSRHEIIWLRKTVSKTIDRVWHAGLLHKLKSYSISGQIFGLISPFLSNRWLQVVLDGKSFKNIQLMLEFLKAPFLVLSFSCYTLITFLMMLSCCCYPPILSVIRHLICGMNLNWLLNLNLIYKRHCGLRQEVTCRF